MSTIEPAFTFRSIALPALLPSLLFAIGEGSIIPVIPAIASNLGATLAVAGFIAGMKKLVQLGGAAFWRRDLLSRARCCGLRSGPACVHDKFCADTVSGARPLDARRYVSP